jgi:hypothetical protein
VRPSLDQRSQILGDFLNQTKIAFVKSEMARLDLLLTAYRWTPMKFAGGPKAKRMNPQMGTDQRKDIKYPQITQITQISSGASDTAKDRTSHQRTLAPVHARTSINRQ